MEVHRKEVKFKEQLWDLYSILTKERESEFQAMISCREVTRKYMREPNGR